MLLFNKSINVVDSSCWTKVAHHLFYPFYAVYACLMAEIVACLLKEIVFNV